MATGEYEQQQYGTGIRISKQMLDDDLAADWAKAVSTVTLASDHTKANTTAFGSITTSTGDASNTLTTLGTLGYIKNRECYPFAKAEPRPPAQKVEPAKQSRLQQVIQQEVRKLLGT